MQNRREGLNSLPVEKLYGYKVCSNLFEDSQFMKAQEKNK